MNFYPSFRRALAACSLFLCLHACGEGQPTDVEVGRALGTVLTDGGRNPLWELKSFRRHGAKLDKKTERMVAKVDYVIVLRMSRTEMLGVLAAAQQAAKPDAEAVGRIETAIALFDVALGQDWKKGDTYGCKGARLELQGTVDGWQLPPDTRFALCTPGDGE